MESSLTRRAVLAGGCGAACTLALTACAGYGAGGPAPVPFGAWEISLRSLNAAERQALQDALAARGLDDVLLVLSCAADTPA